MAKKIGWTGRSRKTMGARKPAYQYALTMDDGREIRFKTEEEVLKAVGVMVDVLADNGVSSSEDFTRENIKVLMSR